MNLLVLLCLSAYVMTQQLLTGFMTFCIGSFKTCEHFQHFLSTSDNNVRHSLEDLHVFLCVDVTRLENPASHVRECSMITSAPYQVTFTLPT
jgi:hypothetical protein